MSNYTNIKGLITTYSGTERHITIPKIYLELVEDYPTAALLNQMIFWSDKTKRKDGFFYKTYKEWEEETLLSEYQVRRASKKMISMGILETDVKRANGSPTLHYRLDMNKLSESILEKLKNRNQRNSSNDTEVCQESLTVDDTVNDYSNNNSPAKAEPVPVKKIIDYLNEQTGRNYSHEAEGNRRLIKARWNERKKVDKDTTDEELLDLFISVINKKVADAHDDNHYFTKEYLRPSTLFNQSKFDQYLNQPDRITEPKEDEWKEWID